MERIVRGYVNQGTSRQESYYFQYTESNIANFILQNGKESNEITIDNILGKNIIKVIGKDGVCQGREKEVKQVEEYLNLLRTGQREATEIRFLDLDDLNNRDEFDSREVEIDEIENLLTGE